MKSGILGDGAEGVGGGAEGKSARIGVADCFYFIVVVCSIYINAGEMVFRGVGANWGDCIGQPLPPPPTDSVSPITHQKP